MINQNWLSSASAILECSSKWKVISKHVTRKAEKMTRRLLKVLLLTGKYGTTMFLTKVLPRNTTSSAESMFSTDNLASLESFFDQPDTMWKVGVQLVPRNLRLICLISIHPAGQPLATQRGNKELLLLSIPPSHRQWEFIFGRCLVLSVWQYYQPAEDWGIQELCAWAVNLGWVKLIRSHGPVAVTELDVLHQGWESIWCTAGAEFPV